MNLRQLEFFKVLADNQHMTQAAELLNTTQPNLSHSMSELEKELDTKLFEKVGRNIRLTKYGKFFYTYVTNALNELSAGEQALREFVSPEKGQIDFGFIYTIGSVLAPLWIQQFLSIPENQQLRFQLAQGNSSDMIDLLLNNEIDLAVTSKIKKNEHIHYEIIDEQEIVLVVPENHPLAAFTHLSLQETKNYPYVYFNQKSGLRPYLDQLFTSIKMIPKIALEVEEDHTMLGFISQGFGVGLMPNIPSIDSYHVKKIEIVDDLEPRYIYLASIKDRFISPAVLKFKEFLIEYQRNQHL